MAAINADAIAVLPKCMNDLLKCGIPDENITVYDMHEGMGGGTAAFPDGLEIIGE